MSQLAPSAIPGPSTLSSDPSRSTLRARFLLKLYEIVNDPTNQALVKWSDAGDSFYIFNQERFAREILGKWFKHQNFSSFVRQLNLYGFRKISSLQQGLLRTDNDSETIQFAHPNFHRGQPDLLSLIHRKRNPPANNAQTDNSTLGLLQTSISQDYQGHNQAVDVHSIVEGINAIRRQQQAIAEDLSAVKQSNDALWKEAIEARERHAKHEDTINRILKFLAGLFGRVIEARSGHGGGKAIQANRFLIENGRAHPVPCEDNDMDTHSEPGSREHTPFSVTSERFATIDSPVASVPTRATITEVHDIGPKSPIKPPQTINSKLQTQQQPIMPFSSSTTAPSTFNPAPTNIPDPSAANPEAIWQASLHQLLTSPEHFQQVLQTFATPSSSPLTSPTIPPPSTFAQPPNPAQQQPWPYPYSFAPPPVPQTAPPDPLVIAPTPVTDVTAQEAALLDNADRLNKTYNHAAEIDEDINDLQSNLQALIHNMGLDPQNVTFPAVEHPAAPPLPPAATDTLASWQDGSDPEFFNSFLAQLAGDPMNPSSSGQLGIKDGGEDFSAFLDMNALDGAPPGSPGAGSAALSSPTGTKRKIEVMEVPEVLESEDGPSSKKKR